MGKKPESVPVWAVFLRGSLLSLAVYLGGILLLAALLVRGVVPEGAAFPVTAALCALGALFGGLLTARRSSWGTLPSAMLNSAVFAAVLAAGNGSKDCFVRIHKFSADSLWGWELGLLLRGSGTLDRSEQIWGFFRWKSPHILSFLVRFSCLFLVFT